MGFVQRRILKLVLGVVNRPKLTLMICGIVLVACVGVAVARLRISTDQNKLFSEKVPFFRDFLGFIHAFPENEALYVLVEARDPEHAPAVGRWTDLADAATDKLRVMPQLVKSVDSHVPIDELGAQGMLFEDPNKLAVNLKEIQQFAPLAKLWGESHPLMFFLGRTPMEKFITSLGMTRADEQTALFAAELSASWVRLLEKPDEPVGIDRNVPDLAAMGASDPAQLGYYYVPDETDKARKILLVRVYPHVERNSLTAVTRTVDSIRDAVQGVAKDYPEFDVGITGRPALEADEMRTTDQDTHRAEIVALIVVFIAMVVALKSVWLALVAEFSLAVGVGWTFGWAAITVGELNLLSIVFVIALIGIGMDYLVQVLTRYRREARRYVRPAAVWARVFRYVSPPIFTACLGAAGAFFVSMLTDFRGAAELGEIAGGGLLLCLLAGYTVLPALLVIWPARVKPVTAEKRYTPPPIYRLHPAMRLILPAIWIALIIAGIPLMMRSGFNPNLLDLQAPNLASVQLIKKVQTWSEVVLSKDLDILHKVRQAVAGAPTVSRTESVLDAADNYRWLLAHQNEVPRISWTAPAPVRVDDLDNLARKSRNLAQRFAPAGGTAAGEAARNLRRFAALLESKGNSSGWKIDGQNASGSRPASAASSAFPPGLSPQLAAQRLSQWQSVFVDELRAMLSQFSPPPLDIAKLPLEMRGHYVSADGTYALYIYPRQDLWNRANLATFVQDVEARIGHVPNAPTVTGIASDIYHSTASIERAFYKATAYALGLIFVLVFLDLKKLVPTLLAVSVLAFGLPMLVAVMGLFKVDWNFANFFGLPILIGAGHEYGVFMLHRYLEVQHNPRRVWSRWDVSDRALLLCAFITSSSFGFFWILAHHRGLKSLGLVMALGTTCIYLATIMVLRPILRWRIERKGFYGRNGSAQQQTS